MSDRKKRYRALRWPDGRVTDISPSTEPRAGAELVEVDEAPEVHDADEVLRLVGGRVVRARTDRGRRRRAFEAWRRRRDLEAWAAATGERIDDLLPPPASAGGATVERDLSEGTR